MILITLTLKKIDLVHHYSGTTTIAWFGNATTTWSDTYYILVHKLHLFQYPVYSGTKAPPILVPSLLWYQGSTYFGTNSPPLPVPAPFSTSFSYLPVLYLHLFWYHLCVSSGTSSPPLLVPTLCLFRYRLHLILDCTYSNTSSI